MLSEAKHLLINEETLRSAHTVPVSFGRVILTFGTDTILIFFLALAGQAQACPANFITILY
jgi:peptide subunit release factor RF-3